MSLSQLSDPAAVERALEEFDRLGRNRFLDKYGFGKASRYHLVRDGKHYDAKAIAGAAHGYQFPEDGPLRAEDFSSGQGTVVPKLRSLGFSVDGRTEPDRGGIRRSFIFQANPRYYDVDSAVRALSEMNWTVAQSAKQIRAGDRVYIWKSGPDRGVIAEGTILTDPAPMADQEGREFILEPEKFDGRQLRVRLSIDRVLEPPLLAATLKQHPLLKRLTVLNFPNATNFSMDPAEAKAMRDLLGSPDSPTPYLERQLSEWKAATGYPTERDERKKDDRARLAGALAEDRLKDVVEDPEKWDSLLVPRLAANAYGDPGNQAYFNRTIRSTESRQRVARALLHLLYGDGDVVQRLDEVLTDESWRVPGLSESLTTKALAVIDPNRWLPLFQYSGDMGRLELMALPELGLPVPPDLEERPLAQRIAVTNDALRERLEPLLPGDPWGQMVFLYWLRDRWRQAKSDSRESDYSEPPFAAVLENVRAAGMKIGERTLLRYHLSLRARGFVILSGVSGTGKTWLPELYAEAVDAAHLLVPVAPNWTANEDLLGYLNPLNDTYQHTLFSRFAESAADEWSRAEADGRPARPFHVTLDEMNLARVEYYFAKFLSAMEVRGRSGEAELELAPGHRISLTPNLRFTGTVNVDETTHGFADKVFDRAQLIELGASREALAERLAGAPFGPTLMEVWDAVHDVAPFAFRVVDEIAAYVAQSEGMRPGWLEPLDEQVLQKILPKLKGADPGIESALIALLELSEEQLPLTHAKAKAMQESFVSHGFASYF